MEDTKVKKSHKKLYITLLSITSAIVIILIAFFSYVSIYYSPTSNCLTYLQDSLKSKVEQKEDCIVFKSKDETNSKDGLIFYPGGKVDYRSYAHLLRDLSDDGINSILVKMPFNLAVFNINAANSKKELLPNVTNWYISGHSLGGSMACSYLNSHNSEYKGLILLASYSTTDLSSYTNLITLSITASNDKVINMDKYNSNKSKLPNLVEYNINGGIHSYFGDYGVMSNDGSPLIDVDTQTNIVKEKILDFVK